MPMSNYTLSIISFILILAGALSASEAKLTLTADNTIKYLLSCQKTNGAFGPLDQEYSDLAWNYPAVHALLILKEDIPRAADCLKNGQWAAFRSKDAHRTNLHWDLYQKAQLNHLLAPKVTGAELDVFPDQRNNGSPAKTGQKWTLQYIDRKGQYYAPYGLGNFYDVASLWYMVSTLTTLNGSIGNKNLVKDFLYTRQASNGAFVDAWNVTSTPSADDAHLITTHHAVMTLDAVGLPVPETEKCAAWIRSCQVPSGGFRWSPTRGDHSNQPDIWYTWAAIHALQKLGSEPGDKAGCIRWITSLLNTDGGFGDRPGWRSRLYSTYYAVESLALLTGDARSAISRTFTPEAPRIIPDNKYSIFQAHLKAPPLENKSPEAMVEAVHAMKFNFIGAKTHEVKKAREYAKAKGYSLEIVANPENYPHKLRRLGGHISDHVSNWFIPVDMSDQEKAIYSKADEAAKQGLPWNEFKAKVISPAFSLGTVFYPEMDFSMMNAYMVYDDGLDGQPGYNSFIAALGWPPWDWVRHFPYRERWVGRLAALADGDSHGEISNWRNRLLKQRILYLAESYTLPHFLKALKEGRSVCVIRDKSTADGFVYYGSQAAVNYIKLHRKEWIWSD